MQTHLLSHWVRDKQAFTLEEAVRLITYDTSTRWGFHDRGLLREGLAADIVVFDPEKVAPRMPAGRRAPPEAVCRRHEGDRGQRPNGAERQHAHGGAARPRAAGSAGGISYRQTRTKGLLLLLPIE